VTLAPSTFGRFGGDILVGNFGNGHINAYDPVTGHHLGWLRTRTAAGSSSLTCGGCDSRQAR
jgi:hypothetical protein